MKYEEIAEKCHEMNRRWCELNGDMSQPAWESAPEWQRSSAISGVVAIAEGSVKCPEDAHRSWAKEKLRDGWTYGPVKNAEKKEHPCLVMYAKLPSEQKVKDTFFFSIVEHYLFKLAEECK